MEKIGEFAMQSLREAFAQMPDYRQAKTQYPLEGLLTLMCLAMLCGCNHVKEIARWAQDKRWDLPERLGFKRERMPSLGTLQRLNRHLDEHDFAQLVAAWGEEVLSAYGQREGIGVAIDGKKLRGSRTDELPAVYLLSALSHQLKQVLGQVVVAPSTNEIGQIDDLLTDLVLEGRIVTVDAQLSQTAIAAHIREKGGTM
jgi:hypothetical protein